MEVCRDIKADGNYKDFGQVLSKLVDVIGMYNECQIKHAGLVDYENKKDTK